MRRRISLSGQFLLFQLGVVFVVVVAVAGVSLAEADRAFRRTEGRRLLTVADSVAGTPTVRLALTEPAGREALPGIAETAKGYSGIDHVVIVSGDGTLLTGPDAGRPAVLGTSDALAGGKGWVGVVDDGTQSLVAHVAVLDGEQVLGLVVAGRRYPTTLELFASALPDLLTYLLLGGFLGVAGSLLLAHRIKRQTLGLEPREIRGLVEHREAMLHGIKEGVIGTDAADRVTLVNDEAVRLLGLPVDAVGRELAGMGIDGRLLDVLAGRDGGADEIVLHEDRVLVLNRMPVTVRGGRVGSVTTLRDRTELTALRRELDLSRYATDTLRAQAHEFTNRLHTIAGLVALEEYDEVVRYITLASRAQEALTQEVTSKIADPSLAALLIAKASLAAERGIELRIGAGSALAPVDEALSADLVTLVGNLVDNAIDALEQGGWIEAELKTSGAEVVVTVRDCGAGVAPELADEVFRQGYTTKAAGDGHQGLGLALSRLICLRRGGSIGVCGSAFTARIPV